MGMLRDGTREYGENVWKSGRKWFWKKLPQLLELELETLRKPK